ncbi:hypothetical protein A3I95_00450 [Candidatus Nomurabacteria bacterium RIFCSPLOWO2_02_FULL_44_12]|uniref:Uncharacterized protein n=1 Tax=Candidatus Nomurabacteria bacterium RIFCSPLOWO2_12_FULL_44_11 TaxID=1801796 RepID=A0A1F6Y6K9_9BACT|nr:MAG: hypothetical protein A3E95_02770 [Candidatus Nomurabacteria bacterium RIFCSPHIGHO2_12_FULL_44_22b]OGJ02003.1 MAG: hypothetical protein A3G53_01825 [Candidatus Nomurabacteria bacterium RIFCSPLOWO2_12_FULL_44_11]OGJ08742.1 MAG: hypothetical protein A3I95_00450 [Candidatus Nomurabacteria bacterium RIFCSPLOWO2_02_FULL_44_12]
MSKRNFILLIIILIIITVAAFWYFDFFKPAVPGETTEGGTNFLSRFNPFGKSSPPPTGGPIPTPTPGSEPPIPTSELKLKKVSSMPVAGFGVFQKERFKEIVATETQITAEGGTPPKKAVAAPPEREFAPALRYVARANGNIYQTFADKIEERRFTSTVMPKIYEAYFGNKGRMVIMRNLKTDDKTIQTFVGTLPEELLGGDTTADNSVVGSFLPENITDLSLSADMTKAFYLFNMNANAGNVIGTTIDLLTNKKVQVFENAFTEWLSFWPNSKMITLTTKPSASVPGYMYALDPNLKTFGRVFGGINGLTTLASPSGKLVLYSDNTLSLYLYHLDTKVSDILGIKTIPEKCVWGAKSDIVYCSVPAGAPTGEYPDQWYQGEISFTDQIWQIDISNGTTRIMLDPGIEPGGETVDGIKLALDEGQNYLFFVNKKTSFLWEFNLR